MNARREVEELIKKVWPSLSASGVENTLRFYDLLLAENEKQNLTRLTSPQDFVEGHVLDVKALLESNLIAFPCMDLGSGGGVPGLLAAAIGGGAWILCDSEIRKADFLGEASRALGLTGVSVVSGRAEGWLKDHSVGSVVARAVGPVDRIYAWLDSCSTWNKLVLLKGPNWKEEWSKFQKSKFRNRLKLGRSFDYTIGSEAKQRTIVELIHVPRGTK